MIFTQHFGALAARPEFTDANDVVQGSTHRRLRREEADQAVEQKAA
ncbi:MAG TPA: hypothetical protein VFJ14_16535 [Nocardioidaceae bacterium]|nr:hypothetical protein [Nocardioidaceae bacterium]